MKFLLDSNVVSELRKIRPHGAVLAWFDSTPKEDIGIPAIVLFELQAGAEITRRQDPVKAAELEAWIQEIGNSFELIPMDAEIAREAARLMEGKTKALLEDGIIAATARVRQLTVVTRNEKDFAHFGVQQLNRFLSNPPIKS